MSVEITPIGDQSRLIWEKKFHALIGISPFNSYFKEERLAKLFDWCFSNFKNINILLPDTISTYTFLAIGYSKEKAEHKTKKEDNYLRNRVFRALEKIGISYEIGKKLVISLSDLRDNENYKAIYNECLKQFNTNQPFREGCILTSKLVLASQKTEFEIPPENIELSIQYLLSELPFFIDTPSILNLSSSLVVYHNFPLFLKSLYKDPVFTSKNQGALQVVIKEGK